jgi:hypothetical protein
LEITQVRLVEGDLQVEHFGVEQEVDGAGVIGVEEAVAVVAGALVVLEAEVLEAVALGEVGNFQFIF